MLSLQVSQIGKGLQKEGVKSLPELTHGVLLRYLTSPLWMLGLAFDIGGAVARAQHMQGGLVLMRRAVQVQ